MKEYWKFKPIIIKEQNPDAYLRKQLKKKPKKDLNYLEAKTLYPNLSPWHNDSSGIPAMFDCKPFDKNRSGALHDIYTKVKKKVTGKKYGRQERGYERHKPEGIPEETAYDIKKTVGEVGEAGIKLAKKGIKHITRKGSVLERVTRPPEELRVKGKGEGVGITKQLGAISEEAGVRKFGERAEQVGVGTALRERLGPRPAVSQTRVIVRRIPGRAGMPPSPQGWYRGQPQQVPFRTAESSYEEIPQELMGQEGIEYSQIPYEQPRKLPPLKTLPDGTVVRTQPYMPVTMRESFVQYRPAMYNPVGREYSLGSRPGGIIPIASFKPVRIRFATFGRRVER